MNKAQKRPTMTKVLSMILALIMVLSLLPLSGFTAEPQAADTSTFMRIFHLDCGRKYFTVDQINELIDTAAANNYTHVELAIGNNGLRFLLDDMSVTVGDKTYDKKKVKEGIQTGNKTYYNAGSANELTQTDMDNIISHAKRQNISIIPLLNSPGHMDAIIDCMETLGIREAAFSASGYGTSARTIDLNNTQAVAFTQALVQKYAKYFADKGCKYFNIGADEYANDIFVDKYNGMGFGYLADNGGYDKFADYVNTLAKAVKDAGMTPMAFNDGIYYNSRTTTTFEPYITICYWTSGGWSGYSPATASFLANKGHKIINTNDGWYYVLGKASGTYGLSGAKTNVQNTKVTDIPGNNDPTAAGAMLCLWCDTPSASYSTTEQENVKYLIKTLSESNPTYFTTVAPAESTVTKDDVSVTAPGLTGLTVETVESDKAPVIAKAAEGKVSAYEVTPTTEDGSAYEAKGSVRLPIPEGWDAARVRGFVVNDDDTVNDGLPGTSENGKFTFTVPHFSVMGIYELSETAYTSTVEVNLTVGGEEKFVQENVNTENQVYNGPKFKDGIADVGAKYANIEGKTERVLGNQITSFTTSGTKGVISDGNDNYMVIDSNGNISNTTDINAATEFTVTRTSRNSSSYTIKADNGYYLRESSGSLNASTNTNNSAWFYNNGFAASYDYYFGYNYYDYLNFGSSWSVSDSSSKTGLYSFTTKTTEGVKGTQITFTGKEVGYTEIQVGDVLYKITVEDKAPDGAMTSSSISLEYWITNQLVYNTKDKEEHTKSIATSTADATTDEGIAITDIAPNQAYSFFDDTVTVYYWQAMRLDANNQQTDETGDDETGNGTTLTHIRYHGGAWQYKTMDGVWHYFQSGDQLVAYYLQKTEVTQEIETYMKDWGYAAPKSGNTPDTSSGYGQVALTVAVVYPDGTVSPAEGDMYSNSTVIYNYKLVDSKGNATARDIGIVAPKNNSQYNISKITVTGGKRTRNTSSNTWTSTDKIEWNKTKNAAGRTWYDETEVWNKSSGTTPMVNGSSREDLYVWSAKNTAKLVLIYLERVEQTTDLQVVYKDDNSGNQIFTYGVGVKYIQGETVPTFKTALMDANDNVIGGTANWPGKNETEDGYLPDDAYVINDSDVKQKFNKVLTQIPDITGVYASGLYEYVGADISDDGKTLTLHYNLKKSDQKTFVVDFGLPIVIPMEEFGIHNIAATVKTVSFDEKDAAMTERTGDYGTGKIDMSAKTVTYTLIETLDNTIAIPIYVTFTDNKVEVLSVFVVPASNVYYEDSFAKFTNADTTTGINKANGQDEKGFWTTVGTTQEATQALSTLGSGKIYGYDEAYKSSTEYSMGSATKVTVDAETSKLGQSPTATFTFKGTGFDIISLTDNTSGTIFVDVYKGDKAEGKAVRSYFVDNYYGYTQNTDGKWVVDQNAKNALYQIPVMKVTDLGVYDTYTVVISVEYDSFFDHTDNKEYTFVLDAIRVYNPMGEYADYTKDNEGYPQYIKLRDSLVDKNTTTNAAAVFIDGADEADIDTYANYGPNNEVYLANGQAISFNAPENADIASIQIGAKSPDGTAKMVVNHDEAGAKTISSATEMYYQIGTKGKESFTITNKGTGILSLTNLKITFTKKSSEVTLAALTDEDQANAVATVRALFAAPTPEVKTFEPERFDASWNKDSVRVGQKATLTVKTSTDVEAITVNGETVDNYKTRYERSGWGWWAEKVEYRVFTYTVTATETMDYEVAAVNAEGTASEPVICTLTVKPAQTNWWDDIWNGFFGKWF